MYSVDFLDFFSRLTMSDLFILCFLSKCLNAEIKRVCVFFLVFPRSFLWHSFCKVKRDFFLKWVFVISETQSHGLHTEMILDLWQEFLFMTAAAARPTSAGPANFWCQARLKEKSTLFHSSRITIIKGNCWILGLTKYLHVVVVLFARIMLLIFGCIEFDAHKHSFS